MKAVCLTTLACTAAALSMTGVALGQESKDWYVNVGVTQLTLADKADFTVAGSPFPGAGITTDPQYTVTAEIGRKINDILSVGFTFGYPPTAKAYGTGALTGLHLADVTYGPMALTALYHPFADKGPFDAWIGGGVSYMWIMDSKDQALTGVDAKDDVGPVFQAGGSYAFNTDWAAFLDVKKALLKTTATGSFGGAPVSADIKMDPLVVSAGIRKTF